MKELSRSQQKEFAKKLYLTEDAITNKERSPRGSDRRRRPSANGSGRKGGGSEGLATDLEKKASWLGCIIRYRPCGRPFNSREDETKRYISSREADTIVKLTNAIKKLETETGIAQKVEIGKQFLVWLRQIDSEAAIRFLPLYDAFIKESMR